MRVQKSQLIIAGLLILFALLAWIAAAGESATYDEPLHVAASLAQKQLGDFRVDSEDPALFKRWLAIAQPETPLPTDSSFWPTIGREAPSQWAWSALTVFNQPGEGPLALIDRARLPMLLIGTALGALIATWAWQLGGPTAGIVAAALFALDPNFIAHSPLAKNDVAAAFGIATTAFALWHVGRRVTVVNVIGLASAVAMTVAFKFSGVVLAGVVPVVLLIRAFATAPWSIATRSPSGRGGRVLIAIAVVCIVAMTDWVTIWASYGFRYAASTDPNVVLDLSAQNASAPLRWIDRAHLLPQSYTFGLAYTLNSAVARKAFLLGRISEVGHWYYFPVAMAVKTPLATIGLLVVAIAMLVRGRVRLHYHVWTLTCLLLPAAVYLAMAMHSNLNIGLRHVLPVYPLAFVAIAAMVSRSRRVAIPLLALLAIESAVAFPNDLAYFNLAAGGPRGGLRLLGDSNLDWGQGLKRLADWQAAHPHDKLYLSYFGTAEPGAYGIDYVNAGAGYSFGLPPVMPDSPGVIAVSATHLQGLYVSEKLQPFYESLRRATPRDVLGGTIYLYDWPLKP